MKKKQKDISQQKIVEKVYKRVTLIEIKRISKDKYRKG